MRIAVSRLSSIGDIILTEPVINRLKRLYPESELHFFTKKEYSQLLDFFEGISYVHHFSGKIKDLTKIENSKYDLVIDLHAKLSTVLLGLWLKADCRLRYRKKSLLRKMIVKKLTEAKITSTVDLYMSVLEKLSFSPVDESKNFKFQEIPVLKIKPVAKSKYAPRVKSALSDNDLGDRKYLIGIFPGANHQTKMYPVEHIISFINMIPRHWQCAFVLLGNSQDKVVCSQIHNYSSGKTIDLSGLFSLGETVCMIDYLDGVISNDSGPMHIAAALGKPQMAIFGPTHTNLGFSPLNSKAIILQKNIDCQPCSLHGGRYCPKKHFICMKGLLPENVKEQFKIMLDSWIIKN